MKNRVLNREYMSQFNSGLILCDLAEAIQRAGYEFMTADVFLEQNSKTRALLISDMGSGLRDAPRKFVPAVCLSLESPILAWDFYHNLNSIAGQFEHLFLWPGTRSRLHGTKSKFHPIHWPNRWRMPQDTPQWKDRSFLVMISTYKEAEGFHGEIGPGNPISSIRPDGNQWKTLPPGYRDSWMESELYSERSRAVEYFGTNCEFSLFGTGWDRADLAQIPSLFQAVAKSFRGPTTPPGPWNKLRFLKDYKFSLCFENTVFPGYITEKIFDCLLTGCIPIYIGAPDIHDFVPAQCFIDFRNFTSYAELADFLNSLPESEAENYREAARQFLSSPSFQRFTIEDFTRRLLAAIGDVAQD